MKNSIRSLAAILVLATSLFALSSCKQEEEDKMMRFSLSVANYTYEGDNYYSVMDYITAVGDAYSRALGMIPRTQYVDFNSGDFETRSSNMKALFDGAELPAAPDISGHYSFTFSLFGTDFTTDSSNLHLIASKTFGN